MDQSSALQTAAPYHHLNDSPGTVGIALKRCFSLLETGLTEHAYIAASMAEVRFQLKSGFRAVRIAAKAAMGELDEGYRLLQDPEFDTELSESEFLSQFMTEFFTRLNLRLENA